MNFHIKLTFNVYISVADESFSAPSEADSIHIDYNEDYFGQDPEIPALKKLSLAFIISFSLANLCFFMSCIICITIL